MIRFVLASLSLACLLGCAAEVFEGLSPAPPAEPTGGSSTAAQPVVQRPLLLHDTACLPPCNRFRAVVGAGQVVDIERVVLPAAGPDHARELREHGLVVYGNIVNEPDGKTLLVDSVLGPAPTYTSRYNGVACYRAPCPTFTASEDGGARIKYGSLDLTLLDPALGESRVFAGLEDGSLRVRGFVAHGDWTTTGNVLYVTGVVDAPLAAGPASSR